MAMYMNPALRSLHTDPPRILEPGKWGSKVRGLAHVQGYRGPKVMHFGTCKFQCQIYQQLQGKAGSRCQICQHLQGFLNILFFISLWPQNKALKLWPAIKTLESTMAEGSDEMPEQSAENQPPQTHSARDHVPPAVTYVPGIAMWRWSEK